MVFSGGGTLKSMEKKLLRLIIWCMLVGSTWFLNSCNIHEDIPVCELNVRFKYDYNMLSADAFHSQVNKVELYVFDKEGLFLFKQMEEGATLATGDYRMKLDVPFGQYKLMAWAGARNSYDITELTPGISHITDLTLKLKRNSSLIINEEIDPLWYGEVIDINYVGTKDQTETINLIKDTNKIRFVFQGYTSDWTINVNDYTYEIRDSNGFLNYDNSLLQDDSLSYQPYYMEQKNESAVIIEMNTMRLMAGRGNRFVVTEKSTGKITFDINLIDFLAMTEMEGHKWSLQEYFDRQDEYAVVLFFHWTEKPEPIDNLWVAGMININGWTWYSQDDEIEI